MGEWEAVLAVVTWRREHNITKEYVCKLSKKATTTTTVYRQESLEGGEALADSCTIHI